VSEPVSGADPGFLISGGVGLEILIFRVTRKWKSKTKTEAHNCQTKLPTYLLVLLCVSYENICKPFANICIYFCRYSCEFTYFEYDITIVII